MLAAKLTDRWRNKHYKNNAEQFLECNPYVIITKLIRKQFMLCNPYVVPEQISQCEP